MSLTVKYADALRFAGDLQMQQAQVIEEEGKLKIWGTVNYQWDKERLWDRLKEQSGWQDEIIADIRVAYDDPYGLYEVQRGDTLSAIAKKIYGDAKAWRAIAALNEDNLPDPDKLRPSQVLKLPSKSAVA